jgi:Flp pilus assembly protein TadG
MRCIFRRALRDERGSTLIETAVALLFVMPMFFWMLEMSMYCYSTAVLQYAARQGVQYAMTHGADAPNCSGQPPSGNTTCINPDTGGANIRQVVAQLARKSGHNMTGLVIYPVWNGSNLPGNSVTVYVQTPYVSYVPLPFIPSQISGTASGNIVF